MAMGSMWRYKPYTARLKLTNNFEPHKNVDNCDGEVSTAQLKVFLKML